VVALYQLLRHRKQISGFGPEETRGTNQILQLVRRRLRELSCVRKTAENRGRYLVDPHVRALRGKYGGDEELIRI
jgi:hypothetical protein